MKKRIYKKTINAFYSHKRMTKTYVKTVYNRIKELYKLDIIEEHPLHWSKPFLNTNKHYYIQIETGGLHYSKYFYICKAELIEKINKIRR